MQLGFAFFIESVLMGVALAMDAFSVSCANGLNEPKMKIGRMCLIAGVFALFQTVMPLIGWFLVRSVAEAFTVFRKFIPWIAFALLGYIGGKMIVEGIRADKNPSEAVEEGAPAVTFGALLLQGIATSIDALSVGFTIEGLAFPAAMLECAIIGIVTFFICIVGLILGKTFGNMLNGKANILGGCILVAIGLHILGSSFFS